MAMYDWNGNGHNDRMDDYMEYNIVNSESGTNSSAQGSGRFGCFFEEIKEYDSKT